MTIPTSPYEPTDDQPDHKTSEVKRRLATQNRRTTNQLALALFALLRDRDVCDQMLVYRALERRVATGRANDGQHVDADRRERALAAFHACWKALYEQPSKRRYERWHTKEGKAEGWPSATFLLNSFERSWTTLVECAGGQPTANMLALRRTANGPAFTPEELIVLLRACAADLKQDWLTFPVYRVWAERELTRPHSPYKRIAIGHPTFHRCGGWACAVSRAGLRSHPPGRPGRKGARPRRRQEAYTREALIGLLREAALACDRPLTFNWYDRHRHEQVRLAAARGEVVGRAGAAVVARRFGCWANALAAAGLIDERARRRRALRRGRTIDESAALTELARALHELGTDVRRRDYERWRVAQLEHGAEHRAIASDRWLCNRFGGWRQAKTAAIQQDGRLQDRKREGGAR